MSIRLDGLGQGLVEEVAEMVLDLLQDFGLNPLRGGTNSTTLTSGLLITAYRDRRDGVGNKDLCVSLPPSQIDLLHTVVALGCREEWREVTEGRKRRRFELNNMAFMKLVVTKIDFPCQQSTFNLKIRLTYLGKHYCT